MQVLLVMTNPIRRAIAEAVEQLGAEPIAAPDLHTAEKALAGPTPPAAILTQVAMPDGNWRDLLDRVRRICANVPVAICTTIEGEERQLLEQDIQATGAYALLHAPCPLPELTALLVHAATTQAQPH